MGRKIPVTIKGKTYPSLTEASLATGYSVDAISEARRKGTLHLLGASLEAKAKALHPSEPPLTVADITAAAEELHKWSVRLRSSAHGDGLTVQRADRLRDLSRRLSAAVKAGGPFLVAPEAQPEGRSDARPRHAVTLPEFQPRA